MPPRFDIEDLRPWIDWTFDRSGGPGGQNVNKVATRATLLFDVDGCDGLSDAQRARIRDRLRSRLSADGRLRVVSQAHRAQSANRAAAEAKLVELLAAALRTPRRRRATRPTPGSRERRLKSKRQQGEKKARRSRPRLPE